MLSVKNKIIAGYVVLIAILVAGNLVSSRSSSEQIDAVQELMGEDMPILMSAQDISLAALEMRRHEKDVLLGAGDQAKQRDALDKMTSASDAALSKLKGLAAQVAADRELGESDKRTAASAHESLARYVAFAGSVAREAAVAGADPAKANERLASGKQDFYEFEKAMAAIRDIAGRMVATRAKEMAEMSATVKNVQMAALAGGVAAGILSALAVVLAVTRPMGRLVAYSEAVSSGDLGARLERTGADEFAVLGGNIEKMVEALRAKIDEAGRMTREAGEEAARARAATKEAQEAMARAESARAEGMREAARGIEQVVAVVASASRMLQERIGEASEGARDQSGRVRETLEAMRSMTATVEDVAESASRAAQSTDKARQEAVSGAGIISEVVGAIGRVRTQAQALKQDMGELGHRAEGIGRVLNVISDIADQTNLLALNAAIEAARAGDAGRGFAVVADEVRKLAEKTMDATREVGEAIRGIQQGTQQNVDNVDAAVETIEKATDLAGRSGEALAGILAQVELAADQVSAIASASGQQSEASGRISRRVEEVDSISGATARNMRESAGEVEELSRQARVLSDLVLAMDSGGRPALGA